MKALITGAARFTPQQFEQIKSLGYDVFACIDNAADLPEDFYGCDVLVCNRLLLFQPPEKFCRVKLIQLTGSGLDHMPLNRLVKGVVLCNARGIYSIPIAEWVVLKLLEIYKNTRFFEQEQEQCRWTKNRELLELAGKTVGIIGTGSIGAETAKRLKAFGCNLLGLNTTGKAHPHFDKVLGIGSLNTFLSRCDAVVLALPLNPQTINLLNEKTLRYMKPDAVLINVSRGGIVNEEDLIAHLDRGLLRGVALDVFQEEPLSPESPLWRHPRVLITPHNAFVSDNINGRLFRLVYDNLKAFRKGEPVLNEVEV